MSSIYTLNSFQCLGLVHQMNSNATTASVFRFLRSATFVKTVRTAVMNSRNCAVCQYPYLDIQKY